MKITLKSKELVKILERQKQVNKEISTIHKELMEADKVHKKLQFKVQRLKDKGVKILDKVVKEQYELGEFAYTGQMEVKDTEKFEIEIHYLFNDIFRDPESLKKRLRKDKEEKANVWADPLMFTGHND